MLNRRAFISSSIGLACISVLPISLSACSADAVASDIVNWMPTIQYSVNTVSSMLSLMDPADAAAIRIAQTALNAAGDILVTQAKAYLATPGQTVLQALQTALLTFQSQLSSTLLAAARIMNPQHQATILTQLNAAGTAASAVFALISQIKGNTLPVKTAAMPTTVAQREQSVDLVQRHYGISRTAAETLYQAYGM